MGAERVLARLREAFGERVSTSAALRETHAHGEDSYPPQLPDAVVFADRVEDISRILALCNEQRIPVVPFGAGTSLEGHVTPVAGGISLDLSRMNRILAVNEPDLDCRVEAGVTRQQLNAALRDHGLFFPVDPGSECTIGGMCATRASGTCAVRYGTIRENVLGLTAVMADGRVVTTGGRVRKSATGYDLTRLLIGSEGTLGVIAEVQLRLWGIPEATMAATCAFATLEGAVQTVIAVMQAGIPVARIELLDEAQMEACIAYSHLEALQPRPTLFLEFHGSEAGVAEQAAAVGEIAAEYGGAGFATARETEARNRLWKARHDAYWAVRAWRTGFRHLITDVVVPISALAEAILGAKQEIAASGLDAPVVGHVGDGNFHTTILYPPDEAGKARAWALDRAIVARALALGGSASGEHGVGLGKREFLVREHGAEAIGVMRAIKQALDPRGILNPGKLLPD